MSDKCPSCELPEKDAFTPRTVYECGSSDYDQRPLTFIQSVECELRSDLKEAEGAVADLMTLNDTLTGEQRSAESLLCGKIERLEAEVERLAEELEDSDAKADSWESSFLEAQLKAEKAEAERDNYKEGLQVIVKQEEALSSVDYIEPATIARAHLKVLNHKEG